MGLSEINIDSRQTLAAYYTEKVKKGAKMESAKKGQQQLTKIAALASSIILLIGLITSPSHALGEEISISATSIRSTQPTLDRQLDTPNSSPVVVSSPQAPTVANSKAPAEPSASSISSKSGANNEPAPAKSGHQATKLRTANVANLISSKKAANVASQQNYDKYQLKATNSNSHNNITPIVPSQIAPDSALAQAVSQVSSSNSDRQKEGEIKNEKVSSPAQVEGATNKKSNQTNSKAKSSSFSLFRKFLPSFISSAGPMAAAAAAAASAVVDKHQMSHSRSSQSSAIVSGDGPLTRASGRIINLLSSSSKKSADHAQFFVRGKQAGIDRQAGGFASSLLSNPLSLGLLFSAPLIPSLLLTPLAIAGLSPAMSAINNFFGDDEEASSTPASSPLAVLTGPSSPLSSLLQGTQPASGLSGSALGSPSASSSSGSFAMQAVQSILGPPGTTEKPLFNPGIFASQGIQNAIGSLSSSSSGGSSSSSASSLSQPSNSPIRNFLGGNLIQTAASMISPSFAAPPSGNQLGSSSSSSQDSDDGPGFMQVASDVFDKVANYMSPEKDIAPASGSSSLTGSSSSPLSALVGLSSYSPFQLSSILASTPFASATSPHHSSSSSSSSSSSAAGTTPRAGFFSTLKNVYELFSSSFLRRQEVGDSNECQQRLICELHQRAMNSKLFRRSIQSNLLELANLDKNLQEQIKNNNNPVQARVDADTKAMLNDFLKATNNFKNGRELVNCSKMFPKCSRVMLLSTANAHLTDVNGNKAIGKFSNLMKKMKFKSNQQHQSQWKLRKASKPNSPVQANNNQQYQATDYLQVAPLSTAQSMPNQAPQAGQLTPADSLKLVQQIMLMSQQQQQQAYASQPQQFNQQPIFNQPTQTIPNYANYPQYQTGPAANNGQQQQMTNFYTDAVAPMYSSTDSPYFSQSQQPQQVVSSEQQQPMQTQSNQQMFNQQQQQQLVPQQLQNYQQYPTSTSTMPEQQQHISTSSADNNKMKAQQQQQQTMTGRANAA